MSTPIFDEMQAEDERRKAAAETSVRWARDDVYAFLALTLLFIAALFVLVLS